MIPKSKSKLNADLPPSFNKNLLDVVASLREEETSKDEKFADFIGRDVSRLISFSDDDKFIKKEVSKSYKKKLNKLLHNFAVLTLNNEYFTKDILEFAKINGLHDIKYKLSPVELYDTFSPAINAWECRLKNLSLLRLSEKIKAYKNTQSLRLIIGDLFINTYLPPKF